MIKTKRYKFTPILGWSASRYDMFDRCKRLYYYQYYAKYDREYSREQIDDLKTLTSIPLEIGNIVHDTLAAILRRLLKTNREIDRQKFEDFVERKIAQQCQHKRFFEVYYTETEAVEPLDLLPAIDESLTSFLDSERFLWIRDHALTGKNEWLIEPPGYGESRIDSLKVYCKVDFLFVVDGIVTILDWKTGKRDQEKGSKQLLGYSTWAAHHLNTSAEKIEAIIAYLRPAYEEAVLKPSEDNLIEFATRVASETEEMYAFCRDVPDNLPLDKESFPMIPKSGFCSYCNYKELCKRI